MKKYVYAFFLLTFILLTAFSCGKDDEPQPPQQDQLPPITQTGAYTFGCLVDGEVWLPKHYSNSIVNPPVVLQAFFIRDQDTVRIREGRFDVPF